MVQKRINLCFDIDDAKQKEVYEYLTRSGRRKTAVVMTALTQTVMRDTYWRNMQMDRDAELCERFANIVRENNSSSELEEVKKVLEAITQKLDTMSVVQVAGKEADSNKEINHTNVDAPAAANEPEMSEDAFNAMLAFM